MHADRQTCRQTVTLITILRSRIPEAVYTRISVGIVSYQALLLKYCVKCRWLGLWCSWRPTEDNGLWRQQFVVTPRLSVFCCYRPVPAAANRSLRHIWIVSLSICLVSRRAQYSPRSSARQLRNLRASSVRWFLVQYSTQLARSSPAGILWA